jgi:hypothetical protein
VRDDFELRRQFPSIPCFAGEIPCSGVTGICSQALESTAGFPAEFIRKGDIAKNSLQIPVKQGISRAWAAGFYGEFRSYFLKAAAWRKLSRRFAIHRSPSTRCVAVHSG